MHYDDIYTFIQLINEGSFSRLADRMHTYQGTISKKILRLEESLGVGLVRRNTRTVQLTTEGQQLYDQLSNQFVTIDEVLEQARQNKIAHGGHLKIALSPSFSAKVIDNYLLDFMADHPELTLDIYYTDREINLVKDNFDLAITLFKPVQDTAVLRKIHQLFATLYASPQYVEKYGLPKDIEDLTTHRLIIPIYPGSRNGTLEGIHLPTQTIIRKKFVNYSLAANSANSNLNFALSGKCIAPLFDFVADDYLANNRLLRILPEFCSLPIDVYLVRHNSYRNKFTELFVKFVDECLKNHSMQVDYNCTLNNVTSLIN